MEGIGSKEQTPQHLWRDGQYGAALAVAPFFWWALWWWNSSIALDLAWPLHRPMLFLLLVLVYPIIEELVFRGALQGTLYRQRWGSRRLGPLSTANFFTSLLFAGFHFFYHTPLWAALVIVPSLTFGYFRDRHQRVLPAIVMHVFYNAGYFWLFPP